jgi:hypothetical protein
MNEISKEIDDLLPLPPATFHILLALADEDRHGYGIIQDVEARTGGELTLSAGTLYRSIQRMLEQGLLIETREPRRRSSMTSDGATTGLRRSARRSPKPKRGG